MTGEPERNNSYIWVLLAKMLIMRTTILTVIVIALALAGCKKEEDSPEGPADVRVKNLSDMTFEELTVDTSGGVEEYGNLESAELSEYRRFEKAYRVAEISAVIDGETFSTGPVNYNYEVVLGKGRFTYEVFIEVFDHRKLAIARVIPEEPLIDE